MPNDTKRVMSYLGTFELDFKTLAKSINGADLGTTRRDVEANLLRGIYVDLNVPFFQDPDTTCDHMCSIFVGEEEWTPAVDRMQRVNKSVMRSLGGEDRTLNTDRLFSIGPYMMDADNMPRITYYAFYKPG